MTHAAHPARRATHWRSAGRSHVRPWGAWAFVEDAARSQQAAEANRARHRLAAWACPVLAVATVLWVVAAIGFTLALACVTLGPAWGVVLMACVLASLVAACACWEGRERLLDGLWVRRDGQRTGVGRG